MKGIIKDKMAIIYTVVLVFKPNLCLVEFLIDFKCF